MKKIMSIMIIIILAINCETAFCTTKSNLKESIENDLQMYSIVIGEEYGDFDKLCYSQPINIQTNTGKTAGMISFVSLNGKCVGYFTINEIDSRYVTTFSPEKNEIIDAALKENVGISVTLSGMEIEKPYFSFELDPIYGEKLENNLVIVDDNFSHTNTTNATGTYTSLNVPIEANIRINGAGICWAACVASLARYRGMSYNAAGVYYTLQSIYGGTPVGTTLWFNRGFREILSELCMTTTMTMNYSSINNYLLTDNPLILDIFTSDGSIGHSIICRYVYQGANSVMYGFMDPNYDVYRYVTINGSSGSFSNFYYAPDYTYTEVRYYRYEG